MPGSTNYGPQAIGMAIGLIIIGDELLSGKRRDKHLPRLIEILGERGLELAWASMVGDDATRLTRLLEQSLGSEDIVFSFGGIGATPDDRTRQCAAAAAGLELVRHPEAVALLEARFGSETYPNRIRMAELPAGSVLIPNPVNQIPGFSLRDHHFVPGFPNMAWPMVEWVLDTRYRDLFGSAPPMERLIRVFDTPESELIPLMESVLDGIPGIAVSSLPSTERRGEIELGVRGTPEGVGLAIEQLAEGLDRLGARWEWSQPT
jgi:molybdopterin-biosynthesis enzyme MoeA-like protein